jgi:hypothetical protein
MQALVVLVIVLVSLFVAYTILKEKKQSVNSSTEEQPNEVEYPIVMQATIPSSSSSVLGKVEPPEPSIPEVSPELIAAVVKQASKAKPKKKAVKKEVDISKDGPAKKGRKPKDKGNDMILS